MSESKRQAVVNLTRQPPGVIRRLAREDFRVFSDVVTHNWIRGNDRSGWPGKSFDWYPTPPHYEDWHDRVHRHPLNMILAARKHTKTTFACCLMLYRSEYTPGHSSLYWANTEGQVEERMGEYDELVEANSDWLQNVHTDTALKRKEFENGSRILTTWVQGAAEGGHVDTSLGDDPMKEFADIPDQRIEEWYGKVIVPMLNPDGLHAIIGTRKRPNDLYELLRTKHEHDDALSDLPSYTLTEYPAVREAWQREYDRPSDLAPQHCYTECDAPELASALALEDDQLSILWPDARSPGWLAKNLGGQGTPYFLREFCMIFRQAEDAIVKRAWIQANAADRAPPQSLADPWQPAGYGRDVTRSLFDDVVVGVDPAGRGRDRFAFVTVGQLTHGETSEGEPVVRRHILDAWQRQEVPPSQFRGKLTALTDRYSPDTIAIEANLNQTWVADDDAIPSPVRRRIETIATTRRKHSWRDGVPSIGGDIEAGVYRFYTAGGDATSDLITALTSIQMDPERGELVGHTPDLVMALYMAHKVLADGGGVASSRVSLQAGGASDMEREREETEREKRRALRDSEIGRAILDDDSPYG